MVQSSMRVLSGIQPSGPLGIGNYVGAMRHWLEMQQQHECLFCVVDLHALTAGLAPQQFQAYVQQTFALFLACGLDPNQHTVFVQSHVSAHAELAWILQTLTGLGELNRMTQFKDKSQRYANHINVGLLTYPTLMAADILLYNAHAVPVGEDQKQHLELTRDLAQRFNQKFSEVFVVPEPYIQALGARVMSLQNPEKKMSKSDENQNGFIALLDDPKVITRKIKRAVTDSEALVAVDANRPGISNLVALFAAFSNQTVAQVTQAYTGKGYGTFKADLAECIIATLQPIQENYHALMADPGYLSSLMQQGAEKAQVIADATLQRVKQVIGLQ